MDKNKLLKVLDMSEDEQLKWLIKYYLKIYQAGKASEIWKEWYRKNRPLEWLAFGLWKGIDPKPLRKAIDIVCIHRKWLKAGKPDREMLLFYGGAIDRIIAALIAGEAK